jgi:hypothetical protein
MQKDAPELHETDGFINQYLVAPCSKKCGRSRIQNIKSPACAVLVQHLEPEVQEGHAPAASGTSGEGRAQQQHFGQRPHAMRIGSKSI